MERFWTQVVWIKPLLNQVGLLILCLFWEVQLLGIHYKFISQRLTKSCVHCRWGFHIILLFCCECWSDSGLWMRKWRLRNEVQGEAFFTCLIGIENLARSCSWTILSYLVIFYSCWFWFWFWICLFGFHLLWAGSIWVLDNVRPKGNQTFKSWVEFLFLRNNYWNLKNWNFLLFSSLFIHFPSNQI